MLRKLLLDGVGPADRLSLDPMAPRLNLITGDNGLGKSFLLDAAWWSLTRTWHEYPAVPTRPDASIGFAFGEQGLLEGRSRWIPEHQGWSRAEDTAPTSGLVVYARVDGSFSVWDPVRSDAQVALPNGDIASEAYQFSASEVLWGLRRKRRSGAIEREHTLCLGLIAEWRDWQRAADPRFELLKGLLAAFGPDDQPLLPGALARPYLDDAELIPTIAMPYGQDVPLLYAPAGVRRMCMLAYLLAWALSEHVLVAARTGKQSTNQIILCFDEPETHLHPRWQRTVLASLLTALQGNMPTRDASIQMLVATHSPLLLASAEPLFEPAQDALWKLDLSGGAVRVERDIWRRRGDANMWLLSDVFDETSPYSPAAHAAMAEAARLMQDAGADERAADRARDRLRRALADTDPFWLGWRAWMRSRGWVP